jgi:hypothetical protein
MAEAKLSIPLRPATEDFAIQRLFKAGEAIPGSIDVIRISVQFPQLFDGLDSDSIACRLPPETGFIQEAQHSGLMPSIAVCPPGAMQRTNPDPGESIEIIAKMAAGIPNRLMA